MYFNPSDTFQKAIRDKDIAALRALLIGIIGADPTFATNEYDDAYEFIQEKSIELNGEVLQIEETYKKQEGEYEKEDGWDEKYFQMQLLWFRYNFAPKERLKLIKEIGSQVYANKPTLGKSKKKNIEEQKKEKLKKDIVAITSGSDNKEIRVFSKKKNFWWLVVLVIVLLVLVCYLILK